MLSVLVWLAMWGQVGTIYGPRSYCAKSADAKRVINCPDPHVPWDEDPPQPSDNPTWTWFTPPAEHVIEIKTVRGHPDHEVSDWRECGADDEVVLANAAINGIFAVICRSTKVTRELWIDGTKFGAIKGLD